MGQYHTIYNKTKKEYFSFGGAKLLEKSFNPVNSTALMVLLCNSNGRGGGDLYVYEGYEYKKLKGKYVKVWKDKNLKALQAQIDLVQGRWAGDEIVIQGDYAESSDQGFIPEDQMDEFSDITHLIIPALRADEELNKIIEHELGFLKKIGSRKANSLGAAR